ncbi:hypothetical protein ELG67_09995 [Rhizobium leguminosarum]|uniref:hypothetical protein n=1 Tax=Rhizobium leguminosarum TaxID=384 RepID=UPI0010377409|nr:hypothetical protein [Rhizobium leguminosarum]TBG89398.1 hypothetical protein ELG67_09995 [Rhizobium leguminosarum]
MRKPPATHGKTLRGSSVFQNTVLYHESDLERRVSTYLQLRKDVRAIYSQYPVLLYRDVDGVLREHICDYCVVFEHGLVVAVAVKHARKTAAMKDLLARIKAEGYHRKNKNGTVTAGAVHDIRLMTEREATYGVYQNAMRIMRARRMRDETEYNRTLAIVQTVTGRFRFGELLRGCQDRAARGTAILLLIDDGVLVPETPGPIDELTMLMVRR